MSKGYNPDFLGEDCTIQMPTFGRSLGQSVLRDSEDLRDGIYSDHINFSIVMNEHTRQLIYSAFNIDQSKLLKETKGLGERRWQTDPNVDDEFQLDNDYYKDRTNRAGKTIENPYDRGHMVMRHNAMWGDTKAEADRGGKATFIYSNASLQHKNLNRDEWVTLETDVVRKLKLAPEKKLTVFTGPVYGDLDRSVHLSDSDSARVPSGFFKVICFKRKNGELGVLTFVIFQDAKVLRDQKGGATVKTDTRYQFTISELQELTGINFGKKLYDANPLWFTEDAERNQRLRVRQVPERIPFHLMNDLVKEHEEVRGEVVKLNERRIVISSAMINPTSPEAENEWVTLYNRGHETLSIAGWKLVDGKGREAKLRGSIAPGDTKKLAGSTKGEIKLPNRGGSLVLYDKNGCIIDHVTWTKYDLARVPEDVAYLFERGQ